MKSIHKILIYIRRHLDFMILDILTFSLAYILSVQIRRGMDIRIHHGELFLKYGVVSVVVYLAVLIASKNLNGIVSRSFPREVESVGIQMFLTWSIYTVLLFLIEEAHEFSRSIYLFSFVFCFLCVLLERSIWKGIVKYSRMKERFSPKVLLICEASKAQTVLTRLLQGAYANQYEIAGVILNERSAVNYKDWYPHEIGLVHIEEYLTDKRIQNAYVELDGADEEADVIRRLLHAGVIVHRSLGDSELDYAGQRINEFSGKSVITIEDTTLSLVGKAERLLKRIAEWRARKADQNR